MHFVDRFVRCSALGFEMEISRELRVIRQTRTVQASRAIGRRVTS